MSIPVDNAAPPQSNPLRVGPDPVSLAERFRSTIMPRAMPRAIMGMLTKNTDRQPNKSTRKPPKAGPTMAPVPTTDMVRPMALPRSLAGKAAAIIAMPVPWVMAAPAPCKIREPISHPKWLDKPAPMANKAKTREPMI